MTPQERRVALDSIDAAKQDYVKATAKGPWSFVAGGQEWVIATEGHILIGVRPSTVSGDCVQCPAIAEGLAGKFFASERFDPKQRLKAADLKAFVGLRDRVRPCAECDGGGRVECTACDGGGTIDCTCDCGDEHQKSCGSCHGSGTRKCECGGVSNRSYAMWLNTPMDRGLLATVLHAVSPSDDSEIMVSIQPYKSLFVFYLQAADDSFRALLMPCRDGVTSRVVFENRETWAHSEPAVAQ